MAPVEDPALRARLLEEVIGMGLKDNVKARQLQADGTYVPRPLALDGQTVRSQMQLLEVVRRQATPVVAEPVLRHVASPLDKPEPRATPGTITAA
jgi:polyphosphate kinase